MTRCLGTQAFIVIVTLISAQAEEQQLDLKKGWNSIFLGVNPEQPDPDLLFAGQPVEIVSLWLPTEGKVVSLTEPSAEINKATEWRTWQPASSPSSFLNNLRAIPGRTALLIKAQAACQVTVSGSPAFKRTEWMGASFNLVGFDIDESQPPTFARFFEGSRAHEEMKVYRLIADRWQKVTGSETMARGEAYWVWCGEGSDFQGPLAVNLSSGSSSFTTGLAGRNLSLRAEGSLPIAWTAQGGSPASGVLEGGGQTTLKVAEDGFSPSSSLVIRGGGMRFQLPLATR